MNQPQLRTREGDSPELSERIRQVRREGRKRTVIMGIIAAGVISMFFSYFLDRDQRARSIANCNLIQADRRDRAEAARETADIADRRADRILGDPNENPPVPPIEFKTAIEKHFKQVVLNSANQNREIAVRNYRREKAILANVEDCNKVFPKLDLLPFF